MIYWEDKENQRKFIFLNALRIAILAILFFTAIFVLLLIEISFSPIPLLAALAMSIILSIVNFVLFKRLKYKVALYIQSMVDIVLISILVYYTGGITSPFYFLYILPIIISSVFLTRQDTIYIATLSYIVFGIICDLIYLKIVPYYPLLTAINVNLNVFIYNLVMSFVAFSSIAILSSYYFHRMRKTGAELKNTKETLKDLSLLNNTVLEKMENGFIISDGKGNIISYNKKARIFFKLESHSNVFELLALKQIGTESELRVRGDAPLKKNYFEENINGRVLGISYSIIEGIYSYDQVFVFIITDLTEKLEIERKLKQKEHFALIGEMSAGIAHEIRNPLASISGSVQFLQKELELDDQPEFQNLMDIIVKESTRLSSSIEVFLDYAKTTPLKIKQYDLSLIVGEVVELVTLNYPDVKLVKKFSMGNTIWADIRKINQVVWNLINNAVKAVSEKGVIEVNIYSRNNNVYLSIKDNGVGIDRIDLERIFTPFYSNFTSGIGLGMAIVKRIIDEHNFEININSQKNIGTEVIICFKKT